METKIDLTAEMKTIKTAMQDLTDDQQQVLNLRFIEGMSNSEIAQQLGKREGAIRALQMRGPAGACQTIGRKDGHMNEFETVFEESWSRMESRELTLDEALASHRA